MSRRTKNVVVVIFEIPRINRVPILHVQSLRSGKNSSDRVSHYHRIRNDGECALVEHDVVIRTENNNVSRNVWSEVWIPERPEMMSFRITSYARQHDWLPAHLTHEFVS